MSHVDDGTLHAYLDGELPPDEARGVDAHLAQCPDCRTRLEEERALIGRADELLGRAAPPDRALPPFRPGDAKAPGRLWWQVRLPLAWAATVVLALGAGLYLGSGTLRREPPAEKRTGDLAASETIAPSKRPASVPARPPAALRVRDNAAVAPRERDRAMAPAAAPAPPTGLLDARSYALTGPPLTVDSARVLLGADPRVVPDLPIRSVHRARMIGYAAVVVVEQPLDSSTAIAVINGRPSQLMLAEVVVAGAAQPDSLAPAARKAKPAAAPARAAATDHADAGLFLDVRGPVPADSLVALRRRLQPLRP
ncbi:MAG: hypothetical protein DMD65_09030 [Gemmatimonadetes bacterium]|nr:MAG: hypothetical protein DMD65_09030 [Gemmatimonadota bacterium]